MTKKIEMIIKDWMVPIAVAFILTALVNKFVFFNIVVPTGSMIPTIELNDRILVTRIYNYNNLKTGEAVVFYSKELKSTLIKRLIGLPGDSITIKQNGDVYVNNKKLSEPYVVHPGGIPTGIGVGKDETGELNYKVPQGEYFFLGDNRVNSLDSRYWANHYISKEDIKGVARFTIFPFNRIGKLK